MNVKMKILFSVSKWADTSLRKIPKFNLMYWCENFVKRQSFRIVSDESPELCGYCAFPQNFHTRKFGEITVFFAVHIANDSKREKFSWWVWSTRCLQKTIDSLLRKTDKSFQESNFTSMAFTLVIIGEWISSSPFCFFGISLKPKPYYPL